ncbi:hypothetical protein AX17_004416 [Amanita inopinata Kibby_2008]|nr:hypothetical protein AX17_004416 [Amanita inopinata Kibby_2008]
MLRIQMGGTYGEAFDMHHGCRQGCPLSPLLFNIFIDSIWEDDTDKVSVPGKNPDKEILISSGRYADDIVGLSSTIVGLRRKIQKVYEWGAKTGMEMGLSKCGVMGWNLSDADRLIYESTTFTTPDGEIPKVTTYKYLGINVSENWHQSGDTMLLSTSDAMLHCKRMADKGQKMLSLLQPLLCDSKIPLVVKIQAIRSLLMSGMAYGAEWTGCRQVFLTAENQVITKALQWSLGLSGSNAATSTDVLNLEFRVPTMYEHQSTMRQRLAAKLERERGRMMTTIQTLQDSTPKLFGIRTWMQANGPWYKQYVRNSNNVDNDEGNGYPAGYQLPLRESIARAQMYEYHSRSNTYHSKHLMHLREAMVGITRTGYIIDREMLGFDERLFQLGIYTSPASTKPEYGQERADQVEEVEASKALHIDADVKELLRVCDTRDSLTESMIRYNKTVSMTWYQCWNLASTRDWVRRSFARPDLNEGLQWLAIVRTGAFPKVEDVTRKACFSQRTITWQDKCCPLCCVAITKGWEWAHLLMDCTHQAVLRNRNRFLAQASTTILMITNEQWNTLPLSKTSELNSIMGGNGEQMGHRMFTAITLIGGVVGDFYDHSYHLGFGQLDWIPITGKGPLAFETASFLQETAPLYCLALGLNVRGRRVKNLA